MNGDQGVEVSEKLSDSRFGTIWTFPFIDTLRDHTGDQQKTPQRR
jgi:hypothetical protein